MSGVAPLSYSSMQLAQIHNICSHHLQPRKVLMRSSPPGFKSPLSRRFSGTVSSGMWLTLALREETGQWPIYNANITFFVIW